MRIAAIVCGVLGLFVVLLMCVIGISFLSYSNSEIGLRNSIAAQQKANEASFDAMWKILQQKAGVADQYREAFKQLFPEIIKGRQGGSLAKFVSEANPNFDTSLYTSLSNSIEAERTRFLNEQKKLVNMKAEHDNLIQKFPGSIFLAGRRPIDVVVITSERTTTVFTTGQDNDTDLFKKGK